MNKESINIISKDLFCETINDLKKAEDYQRGLNDFYREHCADGFLIQPDCSLTVIKLLESMFGQDEMEMSDIYYFCYEIDFGRGYKEGCATNEGINIDLSCAESLYDHLISELNNKNKSGGD